MLGKPLGKHLLRREQKMRGKLVCVWILEGQVLEDTAESNWDYEVCRSFS
jgi:hypothetical protein